MSTTLVLVRHGESLWNAHGLIQGQGGTGLSPLGFAQAEATAAYLLQRYPEAAAAVRSDQERVEQTAGEWETATGLAAVVDKRWREIDVGTWSGLTWDEVAAADPVTLAAWRGGEDVRRGGGETFAELRERVWEAMSEMAGIDGTVIVFTHGGCIRLGVAAAIGLPLMGEHALGPVANCSISELRLDGERARLVSYNVRDHLDGVMPAEV